ncbi:MAG: FAD-binding protein, partial [Nostoc sp. C3-bin3]|nr:FAD-binding protein [Nostoc sp. C3-bin3]
MSSKPLDKSNSHVIVIGAGYAGLMATAALCQRGFRPLVLTKGNGTTHWSHGCIDLLG